MNLSSLDGHMEADWNITVATDVFQNGSSGNSTAPKLSTNETFLLIVIFSLICSIGVVGNLLVIGGIGLDRKMRKSAMNLVLLHLAIADLLNLLICLPDIVLALAGEGWLLAEFLCPTFRFLEQTSLYCSVLLQIAVCGERFIAINYPLKVRLYCTLRRFLVITGLIWAVAAAAAAPHWLQSIEWRNAQKVCKIDRLTRLVPQFKTIEFFTFYAIPLVIITAAYGQISVVLWASSGHLHEGTRPNGNGRTEPTESDRNRKSVVKMLIACVSVYFFCYTPINVIFLVKTLMDKRTFRPPPFSVLLVANALTYSCSGANPLLYTMFSQKFRLRFHQLVTCRKVTGRGADFSTAIHQDGSGDSFQPDGSSRPLYLRLRRTSSTFATRSTISSSRRSRRHSPTLIDYEQSPGHTRKDLNIEMRTDCEFRKLSSP